MSDHLQERNHRFYYRRRVPDDLRTVIGKREWTQTLKAVTRRDAEAKARTIAAEHDALIAAIRSKPEVERAKLAVEEATKAIDAALTTVELRDAYLAGAAKLDAAIETRLEAAEDHLESVRNKLHPAGARVADKMAVADGSAAFAQERLELLLAAQDGRTIELTEFQRLWMALKKAKKPSDLLDVFSARKFNEMIQADKVALARHSTAVRSEAETATKLAVERKAVHRSEDPQNPRIWTVYEQWIAKEQQSADTTRKYEVYIRRLVEFVGPAVPMREVKKRDIIRYLDEAEKLPDTRKLKPKDRALPMAEVIAKRGQWLEDNPDADPTEDWPLITAKTVGKHLDAVKALYGWFASQHDDVTNIARDVKPPKDRRHPDEYEPRAFKIDEEKGINEPEKIMRAAVELWGEHGEMTWLVRLGMMTGARLEELCQLARDNVREVGGAFALVIDDGRFVDDDGKTYRRRLKNDPSKRIVPVHSSLISAGFEAFAKGDTVRLFPSFKRSSGRYGHNPSKAFHRLLHDQIGFVDEFGKRDKRVRFHSLRHTMVTALHNASVPQVQVNAIVGHERAKGAAGGYIDELALPVLRDAIEKVRLV